jgi:hypothetical protein
MSEEGSLALSMRVDVIQILKSSSTVPIAIGMHREARSFTVSNRTLRFYKTTVNRELKTVNFYSCFSSETEFSAGGTT